METKERAEDLQEYIGKELAILTKSLEDGTAQVSEETRQELASIYGSELVNRLFGKRDFSTMPELSNLATSSLKTKALLVAELKIWERLMAEALVNKNKAVVETGEHYKNKTDKLYAELHEDLSRHIGRHLQSIEKSHADILGVLETEAKEVKEIASKGERLRNTDQDSVKRAIEENTEKISKIIMEKIDAKIDEAIKEYIHSEYRTKEFVINQMYCLGYFALGGAFVSVGYLAAKTFLFNLSW